MATDLVEKGLAACVSLTSNVTSVYSWNGNIEKSNEIQLVLKSHKRQFRALQLYIDKNHPYELPELLAVPISDGLPAYLEWINQQTGL